MEQEPEILEVPEKKPDKKNKLEIIKELWQNPKTHAIIVLGLWLVFIAILILFLKISSILGTDTNDNKQVNTLNPLESFNEMTSYEFNYTASDLSLNGLFYKDKYLLYLNNQKYYKNNDLYKIGETIEKAVEPEILKLDNKMIYSLIKDVTPINNTDYDSYLIPLVTFISTYENQTVNDYNLSTYNVVINTYKNNDVVNKITIDLTNYYKYKGINTDSYILTINYYNINNISDFTKEYDEMIGVK